MRSTMTKSGQASPGQCLGALWDGWQHVCSMAALLRLHCCGDDEGQSCVTNNCADGLI